MDVYFPEMHGLGTQPGGFLALATNEGKEDPSVVLFRLSHSCTYLKAKEVTNRIVIENRLIVREENTSEVCFFHVYKAFVSKTLHLLILIGMKRGKSKNSSYSAFCSPKVNPERVILKEPVCITPDS